MRHDAFDDELDNDELDDLHFQCWYEELTVIARKFDINVSDRAGWRECFDEQMSALDALAEEYPIVLGKSAESACKITAEAAAAAINLPLQDWPGNCYAVACQILKAGLAQGRAVYGHYLGPVAPGTLFSGRSLIQHGWIETPDGHIIDPTRWVFENVTPYLYSISVKLTQEYDEGGNRFRAANQKPAPAFNDNETLYYISEPSAPIFNRLLLQPANQIVCSQSQIFWLANLSLLTLQDDAKAVYEELDRLHLLALVPLDNKMKILGQKAHPKNH